MEYRTRGETGTGRRAADRGKMTLGRGERRKLIQLGVCLVLFLAAFFSRGTERLALLRQELTDAVYGSIDTRTVLTDLGWTLAAERPVRETAGTLWNGLFAPEQPQPVQAGRSGPAVEARLMQLQAGPFAPAGTTEEREDPMAHSAARPKPPEPEEPEVVQVDYTGPALPDNATMDRWNLRLEETVTPVLGPVASGFGWREHPIDGGQKFHQGVDLAVPTGTPVRAFAAGTVDYIGESEACGQYLQLRHAGGITSFYCHCSRLLVQEGQQVAAGETVAEVGATGRVTGPHLHFELRREGVLLQPLYYIETQA